MMLKGQRRLVPSHRTKENWGGPLAPVGHCKDFSSYCESMESDWWIQAEKDPGLTFLGKDPWVSCGNIDLGKPVLVQEERLMLLFWRSGENVTEMLLTATSKEGHQRTGWNH